MLILPKMYFAHLLSCVFCQLSLATFWLLHIVKCLEVPPTVIINVLFMICVFCVKTEKTAISMKETVITNEHLVLFSW